MKMMIKTERLVLKALNEYYDGLLLDFVSNNRECFEKYEALKDSEYYTRRYQRNVLKTEEQLMREGKYARYYVFLQDAPQRIIGTVSFGFYRPMPFSSFNVGYKFAPEYQGKGYACEAVHAAVNTIFADTKVHQMYAYIMPENLRSVKLVEKLGFKCEGISERCLCVRGIWEDHFVYRLIND